MEQQKPLEQSKDSVFGDDINSTPISKLQPMVSSNKGRPLEVPVYDPSVEQTQTAVKPKPKHKTKKQRTSTKQQKIKTPPDGLYPNGLYPNGLYPNALYPNALYPAPQPTEQTQTRKRLFVYFERYKHQLGVFALVMALLWYLPKLATLPYVGGTPTLSTTGKAVAALVLAGVYGVYKHIVE